MLDNNTSTQRKTWRSYENMALIGKHGIKSDNTDWHSKDNMSTQKIVQYRHLGDRIIVRG
jgi:hypothetical protein